MIGELINANIRDSVTELARSFREAQPFRHVAIDNFLAPEFCRAICEQFPECFDAHALNENGTVGLKATREKVRTLGQAYKDMDDLVRSADFLQLIGKITGIDDLRYDPYYFGGGTHENRVGQDLDPHIDFNYHPVTSQHRRLNLIIYLNDHWEDAWGGSLQLHRDPYKERGEDEIVTLTPLMNRCVIFETTECSWHGFERIDLPASQKHRSRKSFAIYYYTETRPEQETGDEHSTVYVERHLPDRFQPGVELSQQDVEEIKRLLNRRDQHLKRLYRDIRKLTGALHARRNGAGDIEVPADNPESGSADLQSSLLTIQALRHRINEFEMSTSWRITRPLRAFKRMLSRQA